MGARSISVEVLKALMPPTADHWLQIQSFYNGKPQSARDEALRSASYLAMSLMLAGQERGYGSGPMIGFDPEAVGQILNIPQNFVITLLLSMGPLAAEGNWRRKPRRKNILSFDKF